MENSIEILEMDELYWFLERKCLTKTLKNVYIITDVSRNPRRIVGFDVAADKTAQRIQRIIDQTPEAKKYCTNSNVTYLDVVFPGKHVRNIRDKKDTSWSSESTLI